MASKSPEKIKQRKALGRGLGALLPPVPAASPSAPALADSERLHQVPVDRIDPNPFQPRRVFQQDRLEELAQSIRNDGMIQPVLVQRNGARFTLIIGERRWRAARLAGLRTIPAVVQNIAPDRILEVTLIENIQREDLNPIEVATALNRMIRELDLSHEQVASRTGKDRTTITNLLRLLRLPDDIRDLVAERRISMGHARALLSLDDPDQQRALAEKTAAQGLSVRQLERTVRGLVEPRKGKKEDEGIDPNVLAAVERLEQTLGTRVRLVEQGGKRGKIEIEYYSHEDLDRIYSVIVGE